METDRKCKERGAECAADLAVKEKEIQKLKEQVKRLQQEIKGSA